MNPLILGQAIGDAFGAPFEFHANAFSLALSSIEQERYLNAVQDCGSLPERNRLPGLYTDDTQQALLLLWVFEEMRLRGLNPMNAVAVGKLFMKLCKLMSQQVNLHPTSFGAHRGTGKNFRSAIMQMRAMHTPGLGAAMRVGPVMALLPSEGDVVPWVTTVSSATTKHPQALESASCYALAVWQQHHQGKQDLSRFPQYVEALRVLDRGGVDGLMAYAEAVWKPTEAQKGPGFGYGPTGVVWCLHIANHATSYEQAMVDACSYGGDTDTLCAMVGCLLGARGLAIPDWMVDRKAWETLNPSFWHPVHTEQHLTSLEARFLLGGGEP